MRFYHLISLLYLSALGCGNVQTPGSSSTCDTHQTSILVGDGFMQIMCGCTEADGTRAMAPQALTCHTASSSAKVFITYSGNLKHQIISRTTSTDQFVSSPVSDPNADIPIRSYGFSFPNSTRTYDGMDSFTQQSIQFIVP